MTIALTAPGLDKLFATSSVAGPADITELARLLSAGGMHAAVWVLESHMADVGLLEAELDALDDWHSPAAHDEAIKEKDEEIEKCAAEITRLEAEVARQDCILEDKDPGGALRDALETIESHRITINAQAQKIQHLEHDLAAKRRPKSVKGKL